MTFHTPADKARENSVALKVEPKLNVQLIRYPDLNPIDWYAVRDEQVVALLELKGRNNASFKYETVFLSLRKWLALMMARQGFGVPGIYVVEFTDNIYWIPVENVHGSKLKLKGHATRERAFHDIEPMIEVPVSDMFLL